MVTVNMRDAKTHLSRLVARAEGGEPIIIARDGKPIARLVPYVERVGQREFGQMRGQITIADDFDAPLPPNVLAAFDGPSAA